MTEHDHERTLTLPAGSAFATVQNQWQATMVGETWQTTVPRVDDAATVEFDAVCRLDTPIEVDYYRNGGILHYVLRDFLSASKEGAKVEA